MRTPVCQRRQIMPDMARCSLLLYSEGVPANRDDIFVISGKRTPHRTTCLRIDKPNKNNALHEIYRGWHVHCFNILSEPPAKGNGGFDSGFG